MNTGSNLKENSFRTMEAEYDIICSKYCARPSIRHKADFFRAQELSRKRAELRRLKTMVEKYGKIWLLDNIDNICFENVFN